MKRYYIATMVGLAIGLASILTWALFGWFQHTSWSIPALATVSDTRLTDSMTRSMLSQAILLRGAHLLIDDGFSYVAGPILLCLCLAKLDDLGNTRPLCFRIVFAFKFALWVSLSVAVLFPLCGLIAPIEKPAIFQLLLSEWYSGIFLFAIFWCSGAAPLLALVTLFALHTMRVTKEVTT